jgi:alpha-L-rhamnosidase
MHVWISSRAARAAAPATPAHYLRAGFRLPADAVAATLRYTALGIAEPWINGERVAADFFTPGWSDARHRVYEVSHEVAASLRAGENRWGFVLADGWCGAPFGPRGHERVFADHTLLAAELRVRCADGSEHVFATGPDWRTRASPVVEHSIYHGETFDARLETPGWCVPGGGGPGWVPVAVMAAPAVEVTPKKCAPVRVTARLAPVRVWRDAEGRRLADFGQNIAGVVEISLRADAGVRVTLRFAEMLGADGALYTENLRDARATDVYICAGAGAGTGAPEVWHPRFTFHGFRYAEVSGLANDAPDPGLCALVLHNDLRATGRFACS